MNESHIDKLSVCEIKRKRKYLNESGFALPNILGSEGIGLRKKLKCISKSVNWFI